jgi:hypothetical protein
MSEMSFLFLGKKGMIFENSFFSDFSSICGFCYKSCSSFSFWFFMMLSASPMSRLYNYLKSLKIFDRSHSQLSAWLHSYFFSLGSPSLSNDT